MALVKVKPTSPGRRGLVKVVNANLYKGRPIDALMEPSDDQRKVLVARLGGR